MHAGIVGRTTRIAAAATLAGAAVLATTVTASAAPGQPLPASFEVGVGTSFHWGSTIGNEATDLQALKAAGISRIREDVLWHLVQPSSASSWDWSRYDQMFGTAADKGVEVLPILGYGAPWSTGSDLHTMPSTDAQRSAFAAYAKAVVARYGVGGTFWQGRLPAASKPITAVEVWNEPWYPGPASPTSYAALVTATSRAVKSAVPSTTVIANVDDRIRTLADKSVQNWGNAVMNALAPGASGVDAWAIHPYPRAGRPATVTSAQDSLAQVVELQAELRSHALLGPVWVTELGFSDVPSGTDPQGSVSATASAFSQVRTAWASTAGINPVTRLFAFTLNRPGTGNSSENGYSLLTTTGAQKPGLLALVAPKTTPLVTLTAPRTPKRLSWYALLLLRAQA